MGLSVAKILAAKGANVAIVARDQTKLARAVAEIEVFTPLPSRIALPSRSRANPP